jgi:hypothetical protein
MYIWNAPVRAAEANPRTRERFVVLSGAAILGAIALSTFTASLNVDFSPPASAVQAGQAFTASLNVKRAGLPVDDAQPLVAVTTQSGRTHYFEAQPGARPGSYRVKIVLPEGGSWTYEVRVGERVYERGTVRGQQPSLPEGL